MNTQLETIRKLLELKVGDTQRLEELQQRVEKNLILYLSDKQYIETLSQQYLSGWIPTAVKSITLESKPVNEIIESKSEIKAKPLEDTKTIQSPEQKSVEISDHILLQNESKPKKSKFLFKRKKKESKSSIVNTELDWFWDKVEFRRQSKLSIVLGILTIIFSFMIFVMASSFTYGMGSSDKSGIMIVVFIMWILIIMTGITLISLGARQVPKYPSLVTAIEDYVNEKIKDSTKK